MCCDTVKNMGKLSHLKVNVLVWYINGQKIPMLQIESFVSVSNTLKKKCNKRVEEINKKYFKIFIKQCSQKLINMDFKI